MLFLCKFKISASIFDKLVDESNNAIIKSDSSNELNDDFVTAKSISLLVKPIPPVSTRT